MSGKRGVFWIESFHHDQQWQEYVKTTFGNFWRFHPLSPHPPAAFHLPDTGCLHSPQLKAIDQIPSFKKS